MKQKLICITTSLSDRKELDELLADGWKIASISAAGTNLSNYCWVLLEK